MKHLAVRHGPCGSIYSGVHELLAHARTCERSNPWGAFFAAPNRTEARRILVEHLGALPPTPMSEEAKERLRDPEVRKRSAERRKRIKETIKALGRAARRGRRRS